MFSRMINKIDILAAAVAIFGIVFTGLYGVFITIGGIGGVKLLDSTGFQTIIIAFVGIASALMIAYQISVSRRLAAKERAQDLVHRCEFALNIISNLMFQISYAEKENKKLGASDTSEGDVVQWLAFARDRIRYEQLLTHPAFIEMGDMHFGLNSYAISCCYDYAEKAKNLRRAINFDDFSYFMGEYSVAVHLSYCRASLKIAAEILNTQKESLCNKYDIQTTDQRHQTRPVFKDFQFNRSIE